jgi:hypothetical protein
MAKSTQGSTRGNQKVIRDATTVNQGKVQLGDMTPVFRFGEKAIPDAPTADEGKIRLGDMAPVFSPTK